MILDSKYGEVKIFAETIDDETINQIIQMANSPLGENAHVRIMPDCHKGAGCTIGTTMHITNKICPNIVGVDISCGVNLVKTNIDFSTRLEELDNIIRLNVPYGMNVNEEATDEGFPFESLRCWNFLSKDVKDKAYLSIGTLGGGNHFLEAYENGYLSVHTGSRNLGLNVAKHYQKLAEQKCGSFELKEVIKTIEPQKRENFIKEYKVLHSFPKELSYLVGSAMEDYLHDVAIMQQFAEKNRKKIIEKIVFLMGGDIVEQISSVHNYIDIENKILRKGAISAQKGELLVIPLNMRDGLLVCEGKGNADWNYSAPHGAGRLYSRSAAKETFTIEQYKEAMAGIFSTSVNQATIDEAPFAYKNFEEIERCIDPTVRIIKRLKPIYNFKADN